MRLHTKTIGILMLAFNLLLPALTAVDTESTALDRYVAKPDPSFAFRLVRSTQSSGVKIHILELTSQTWLTDAEVDRPVWKHWLAIYEPAQVSSTAAILVVDSGSNDEPEYDVDSDLVEVAGLTGLVVADLWMVPNQPVVFRDESRQRSEDAIIAYTWDKFLRGHGEEWPLQLPMTKAVVRGMDAVTQFSRTAAAGGHTIDRYVLIGGSKRGWTTWLTAAVDDRVIAIVPGVIDLLNIEPSLRHHWQAYGFWAPAIGDYPQMGIMGWLGSAAMKNLLEIVDPYEYRERFSIPKYIVNASGDQYFVPTSSQFYFDDLPDKKYMWYVPNASHSLEEQDDAATESVFSWAAATIGGTPMPRFSWELPEDGRIILNTSDQPLAVKLWQVTNPSARDFRLERIGATWRSTTVQRSGSGSYEAPAPAPSQGWTAYYLEMTYPSGNPYPFRFSTPVRVIPDTLPYSPPLASVLAASYDPLIAPDAIVSAFGVDLAEHLETVQELPLPTELAGVGARVTDKLGVTRDAQLFFVSLGQLNFLLPAGAVPGVGRVEIIRDGGEVATGQLLIDPLTPGLFSANVSGKGVAAAIAITVRPDGTRDWRSVSDDTKPAGSRTAVAIGLGSEGDQVYLSLFGTGMRSGTTATATIGGLAVPVYGPVESPEFAGVEQVNLGPLPRSLAGIGPAEIVLTVDGIKANSLTVSIE